VTANGSVGIPCHKDGIRPNGWRSAKRPDGSSTGSYQVVWDTARDGTQIWTERNEDRADWLWRTRKRLTECLNELGLDGWQVVSDLNFYGVRDLLLMRPVKE